MTDSYDTVQVRNLSDRQFADAFNGRRFLIPANGFAIVPKEAAYVWFGEGPHFVKDPKTKRDREAEHLRLRGRYGCLPGSENEKAWESVRPRVQVSEHDGTEWVLVIDDPSTDNLPDSVVNASPDLQVQVEALQSQLARLQAQMQGSVSSPLGEVPEDKPIPPQARRRGRPPKVTVPAEVERDVAEGWAEDEVGDV